MNAIAIAYWNFKIAIKPETLLEMSNFSAFHWGFHHPCLVVLCKTPYACMFLVNFQDPLADIIIMPVVKCSTHLNFGFDLASRWDTFQVKYCQGQVIGS